jgi:hypothetical protein
VRVLLAAKYVPSGRRPIGGVQSWIGTVAAELVQQGHAVTTWEPGQDLAGTFDLGLVANPAHTRPIWAYCERTVQVCHGIIPEEAPASGADAYAFTSEGVREHWRHTGTIVRQPIDLAFWSPGSGRRALVRYSYRRGLPYLPDVADRLGMAFRHLRDATHAQAREELRGAACVLATGRAALEAMACGVPVVILDHRSAYQGPLLDRDPLGAMSRNYSGRGGIEPTDDDVENAIRSAIAVGSLRRHVERFHDVRKIVKELLCI